jgi:peptide-methionine (R)-S-oxide reductase
LLEVIDISEKDWKKILSKEEYLILRERGDETRFSGKYLYNEKNGEYVCVGCRNILFSSAKKVDMHTGWLDFLTPISKEKIKINTNSNFGKKEKEVLCRVCSGHLGYQINSKQKNKFQYYSINSTALRFKEKKKF